MQLTIARFSLWSSYEPCPLLLVPVCSDLSSMLVATPISSNYAHRPLREHFLLPLGIILNELFGVLGESVIHRLKRGLALLST